MMARVCQFLCCHRNLSPSSSPVIPEFDGKKRIDLPGGWVLFFKDEENMMTDYRVVALRKETVDEVRSTLRAPGYGHPAHVETATGYGPCRSCLQPFKQGEDERVLFTYNPFPPHADLPGPGPIFVHKASCSRYEASGFPPGLRGLPLTLEGYDDGGVAVVRARVADDAQASVEDILSSPRVAYAHIRNTEAGCFIARVERVEPPTKNVRA